MPKIQIAASFTPELQVELEDWAISNGYVNKAGEPVLGAAVTKLVADGIGYDLSQDVAATSNTKVAKSDEQRKAEQRARDQANKAAAQARLEALRAARNQQPTELAHKAAKAS